MNEQGNVINLRYYEGLWGMYAAQYELATYKKSFRDGEIAHDTRTRLGQIINDFCNSSSRIMEFLGVTDDQFPDFLTGSIPEPVLKKLEELIEITRDHSNACLRS